MSSHLCDAFENVNICIWVYCLKSIVFVCGRKLVAKVNVCFRKPFSVDKS